MGVSDWKTFSSVSGLDWFAPIGRRDGQETAREVVRTDVQTPTASAPDWRLHGASIKHDVVRSDLSGSQLLRSSCPRRSASRQDSFDRKADSLSRSNSVSLS